MGLVESIKNTSETFFFPFLQSLLIPIHDCSGEIAINITLFYTESS